MDEAFDVALIKQVKKYTMLYNINAKGYPNVEKKTRIWNAIGKRLNSTGQICFKRWTSMRNCYRQNVERSRKRGRAPTWIYYKLMNFLENYPHPKQVKIFASQSSKKDNDELSNDAEMVENMDEEELCWRLIEEVQKREELYNKKSPIYYDTAKRGETWKEIAKCLDRSENACKDKWRSFRDIYIKIRKRNLMNGYGSSRRWKYYEKMKFLDDYITLNISKNTNNLSDGLKNCDETGDIDLTTTAIEYDSEQNSCDMQNDTAANMKKKREFTKEDNLQLIRFVESEPILYSRKWANRSNVFRRRKWEQIARKLQTNAQTCKERWRCLRDQYIKLKKRQNDIGSDLSWLYFHELTFLNEHIGKKAAEKIEYDNTETISSNMGNSEESGEEQERSEQNNEISVQLPTDMTTEIVYNIKPDVDLNYVCDNEERMSLSSNELITFEADTITELPTEHDWPDGIEYKYERVENTSVKAEDDDEFIREELDFDDQDDDEPILYLQSNSSSDSSLSLSPSNKQADKKSLFTNLKDFLQNSKQPCTTCQEQQKIDKDSTTLLFESLALSIKKSQLSDCEILELQADIHSYVIQRLVEFNNRRKADGIL